MATTDQQVPYVPPVGNSVDASWETRTVYSAPVGTVAVLTWVPEQRRRVVIWS